MHYNTHVRTHTKEHLHYCSQCSYSSITKNCLKRHVIQRHSDILLKCPSEGCQYCTPDKYKLQAHLKTHSDIVSAGNLFILEMSAKWLLYQVWFLIFRSKEVLHVQYVKSLFLRTKLELISKATIQVSTNQTRWNITQDLWITFMDVLCLYRCVVELHLGSVGNTCTCERSDRQTSFQMPVLWLFLHKEWGRSSAAHMGSWGWVLSFFLNVLLLNYVVKCTDCVLIASLGLKPYKCSQCEYASRSKSNLKAHMNRHSTEKTHLCDLCGKKFKSKCTLKSHKVMHTADGETLTLCLRRHAVLFGLVYFV